MTDSLINTLFHHRLLDSVSEAAIYLDGQGKILIWNRVAEQLSGRSADAVLHCLWTPKIMGLHCQQGQPIDDESCPLRRALATSTKSSANLYVEHVAGRRYRVVLTAIPPVLAGWLATDSWC